MFQQTERVKIYDALVNVLSLGLAHKVIEDSKLVITGLQSLYPEKRELDALEAVIAAHYGNHRDARRILMNVMVAVPEWDLGKAYLAVLQHALGDIAWEGSARDVMDNNPGVAARNMIRGIKAERGMRGANELFGVEYLVNETQDQTGLPGIPVLSGSIFWHG